MKFDIEQKVNPNLKNYREEDLRIAYKFAGDIKKELGNFVKAIVIFGSTARKKAVTGDIDILVVVDDISISLAQELVEAYRVIVQKLIVRISTKLHIISLRFT